MREWRDFPELSSVVEFQKFISTIVDGRHVLDPKSCPGHPWLKYGNANQIVFGYDFLLGYQSDNVYLLYKAVIERFEQLEQAPTMDKIFPFIKQEPHKLEKLDSGRYRIISGVGATDQLVAELLFRPLLDQSQSLCFWNGVAIGWAPLLWEGVRSFNTFTRSKVVAADKSSWDWTVVPWQTEFSIQFLEKLVPVSGQVVRNHVKAILGPKTWEFRGQRFSTLSDGVMPSGWKLTIFMNSILQLACHEMAGGCGSVLAMGDDTIQEQESDEYWEKLEKLGPIIKEKHTDRKEFCGCLFTPDSYHPVYEGKHAFLLENLKEDVAVETLTSYQFLYAYDDLKLDFIQDWLRDLGFGEMIIPRTKLGGGR